MKLAGGTVADCGGPCESDAPQISATVVDPAAVNGFYPAHATITLNAIDAAGGGSAASGIKRVLWRTAIRARAADSPSRSIRLLPR